MSKLYNELAILPTFTYHNDMHWTKRDDQRLMNCYKKIPTDKLMLLFPNRTYLALQSRAYILKIPRKGQWYSFEEDVLLMELYYHTALTYSQMTPHFTNRSADSLRVRMWNIRKTRARARR